MRSIDYSWQRILLHTVCLCRRPEHARFHLQGIARELPGSHSDSDNTFTCSDAALLFFSAAAAVASQVVVQFYA